MIPKEILKQVKYIEIRTTKLVNEFFGGEYLSVFKGHGMEFSNVREYTYGDDIRTIDWNVTARTGVPQVKQFIEERELSVFFLVDISSSLKFGSKEKLKSDVAAEISSLLAFAAVKNNDKVGLVMTTDMVEKYVPLKKGRQHVLRVVREILFNKPEGRKTRLAQAFEFIRRVLTRRAIIFLISDFLDSGYEIPLKIVSRYHDVIALPLYDPRETDIPAIGRVTFEDPESSDIITVDTSSRRFREQYAARCRLDTATLERSLQHIGIDHVFIDITKPYVYPLMTFFQGRTRKAARR